MNRLLALFVCGVIGIAVGCEKETTTTQNPSSPGSPSTPTTAAAKADDHDHDHDHAKGGKGDAHAGEKHDLGTKQAGGYSVKATQIGELKGGGEGVFEIAVTGGTAKPTAVRAWVGTEAGEGSAKAKGDATENDYDVHVEVPATLPANSKLWVELEAASGRQRASFDLPKEDDHKHDEKSK